MKLKHITLLALFLTSCSSVSSSNSKTVSDFSSKISTEQASLQQGEKNSTIVPTTYGNVEGINSNGIFSFLGVQYAQANERFIRATEPDSWDGIKEAKNYGKVSIQGSLLGMNASNGANNDNNCQNLNIWTPGTNDNANRPVMVWLHGGGFVTGSANDGQSNGSDLAARENVVVVGVNHRLGAFGFLNLEDYGDKYADSANLCMWDIIESLKYIKNNISNFGGDPENITVFGQSGGGAKVIALTASIAAKGLFKKGIVQSGATPFNGPTFHSLEQSRRITELTLQTLGLNETNIDDIQNKTINEINNAGNNAINQVAREYQIPAPLDSSSYQTEWMPVVDNSFLLTQPVKDDGTFADAGNDISLIIGSNLVEWTMYSGSYTVTDEIRDAFIKAYPNKSASSANRVDTLIRLPLLKIANAKAKQNGKVYMYVYANGTSSHGAELNHVFAHTDNDLGRTISSFWASFARDGIPQADGIDEWEAYNQENGNTMIIDTDSYLAQHHDDILLSLIYG